MVSVQDVTGRFSYLSATTRIESIPKVDSLVPASSTCSGVACFFPFQGDRTSTFLYTPETLTVMLVQIADIFRTMDIRGLGYVGPDALQELFGRFGCAVPNPSSVGCVHPGGCRLNTPRHANPECQTFTPEQISDTPSTLNPQP